ncbi:uncharacterized protein LOC126659688 [Mercurialis annua]|uniref:uncharacterized protein LOC126659688 n=1 Tax=Mercurialis annua TaxID=3986 RepID=UPI002160CA1C|nr:uncharacterized protein LOC126659688 [Mercurialis annua]
MNGSGFSSLFGTIPQTPGTIQFSSGSITAENGSSRVVNNGSSRVVNNGSSRRVRIKRNNPVLSSVSNNQPVQSISSSSVSQGLFGFEPIFSSTTQPNDNASKTGTTLSHETECNNSNEMEENKEAKEPNPKPVSTSLIIVSTILKGMPQSPHFYQFRNYSELTRMNLIASWNSIFEETVEKIRSLRVNDFRVGADELWKTLNELQTIGYNVVPLRRRLVELSDVITELNMSKLRIKTLRIKAENCRFEKSRVEFVILNLQEMIKQQQKGMEKDLDEVTGLEKELPKFDEVFAKLAMEMI